MKRLLALVAFALLLQVPAVEASSHDAPAGLRAIVTEVDGSEQTVEFRYPVSAQDPDQDAGSWTYTLYIDVGGVPTTLGTGTLVSATGGLRTVFVELGDATPGTEIFTVTADDGSTEEESCAVAVDMSDEGDYHACGTLVPNWTTHLCMGGTGVDTGSNWEESVEYNDGSFSFNVGTAAGYNLGGDSHAFKWTNTLRMQADGLVGKIKFFFSEVPGTASKAASGDQETSGSFQDGWGVSFQEAGNDYTVALFRITTGITVTEWSQTFSAGINSNNYADGYFEVNPYEGAIKVALGSELQVISDSGFTIENFHTFWIIGERSGDALLQRDTGTQNCIQSLDVELGGTDLGAGFESEGGQGLEGFEGQGGLGGDPMFPGIAVADQATAMGMETDALAMLLATLLVLALVISGFWLAAAGGAGVGGILGLSLAATFNLMPLWLLVVLFLVSAGLVVVGFGRRG